MFIRDLTVSELQTYVQRSHETCPFCKLELKNLMNGGPIFHSELKEHSELKKHSEQKHTHIKPFHCEACGLMLASFNLLQKHVGNQ